MNKQITFCNNQKCFHAKIISEENRNRKVFVRTTSVEGFSFEGFIQKNKVHGFGKLFHNGVLFYEGNWKNGYFDGNGTLLGAYGVLPAIEGHFKKGKMHGKIIMYNESGRKKFEGIYKNNIRVHGDVLQNGDLHYRGHFNKKLEYHGKGILYDKENDILYEGDFKNGKYNGNGRENYEDGDYIIGSFKNNLVEGKAKLYDKNGHLKFDGIFKNDKKRRGKSYRENNELKYDGFFKNDKLEGKGIYYHVNGDRHEGMFKANKIEGKGKKFYPNGNLKYEGDFKNNALNGKGKEYSQGGILTYKGGFKNNLYHGHGEDYFAEGDIRYIGKFKNGVEHGKGTYYTEQGNMLEGISKNGQLEGKVKEYTPNRRIHAIYKYSNGEANGKGIIFHTNGNKKFEGMFVESIRHGPGTEYNEDGTILRKGHWEADNFCPNLENARAQTINQSNIKKFLQTRDQKHLKKVTATMIKKYLKKYGNVDKNGTKKKLIQELERWNASQRHRRNNQEQQQELDLFGNIIETRCRGNDGNIYDLRSLEKLFEKNERGRYVNIPYRNSRPVFPIMANGIRLSSYQVL